MIDGVPDEKDVSERMVASRILRLARGMGVSRAVFYAIAARGWQLLSGPVTVLVIARFYSPELQGFYYAFSSILALQGFFELGLFNVIVNVAAHEWAHADGDGRAPTDAGGRARARLGSLARFVLRWYGIVALFFFVAVSIAGIAFLSKASESTHIDWLGPWVTVVAVTALHLVMMPFNSLLEGCNRVASVNRYLLVQGVLSAIALWVVIPVGGGLWAVAASAVVRAGSNLAFLAVAHGAFLGGLLRSAGDARGMNWRSEIWPLQWRIGIQGGVSWFHYSLFVPVLFYYAGPAEAGRFGMTWQIVTTLQVAAYAWVQTRIPEMGIHAARRDYASLDALWRRGLGFALAALVAGSVAFEIAVVAIGAFLPELGARLLDAQTTAILSAGRILFLGVLGIAAYVRAHRIEPFAPMMLSVSLLQGCFAWVAGMRYGAAGQAWSMLAVYLVVAVPWAIYIHGRTRREERVGASTAA